MRILIEKQTETRTITLGVVALIVGLCVAPAAVAQVNTIKTPPGQNSDTFQIPLDIHVGPGPAVSSGDPLGWAGGLLIMHITDATEMDLDFLDAAPGLLGNLLGPPNTPFITIADPFGPRSSNVQSSPLSVNIFIPPSVMSSGTPIPSSVSTQLARMIVHVKGSSPAGNSDVDLTAQLWNIWHAGTATLQLAASDLLWVPGIQTGITTPFISSVPGGLSNSTAHWIHNTGNQTLMVAPSVYMATFAGTVALGIEHVPEPTTASLLGLGVAAFAASRVMRRRRISS